MFAMRSTGYYVSVIFSHRASETAWCWSWRQWQYYHSMELWPCCDSPKVR